MPSGNNPLEILRRPELTGPMLARVIPNSGTARAFMGRTTLNSGSATVTVSTALVGSLDLIFAGFEHHTNFKLAFGTAQINSGATSVTVSKAAVSSDSLIFLSIMPPITLNTKQNSGVEQPVEVRSIRQGVSFMIANAAARTSRAAATRVHYMIMPANGLPSKIEVKSISPGNFFTLGRADNISHPRDEKVMWQLVKAG